MNITITFCEGPHDVAFLSRILKIDFYKTYHIQIKDYPEPLNEIFENSMKNQKYDELNIEQISSRVLPRKILKKDDNIILLYALGGNRQYDRAREILDVFSIMIQNDDDLIGVDNNNSYNFLFFNDADEDLDTEVTKINKFLTEYYNKSISLSHNNIEDAKGIYIFSHDGIKGTLESLLKSIVQIDNEELCIDIDNFYTKYFNQGKMKRLKLINKDGVLTEKRDKKQKEYKTKATINIAGQLQNSGVSQVVTIEHSDLITLHKLKSDDNVKDIVKFFRKVER